MVGSMVEEKALTRSVLKTGESPGFSGFGRVIPVLAG